MFFRPNSHAGRDIWLAVPSRKTISVLENYKEVSLHGSQTLVHNRSSQKASTNSRPWAGT